MHERSSAASTSSVINHPLNENSSIQNPSSSTPAAITNTTTNINNTRTSTSTTISSKQKIMGPSIQDLSTKSPAKLIIK